MKIRLAYRFGPEPGAPPDAQASSDGAWTAAWDRPPEPGDVVGVGRTVAEAIGCLMLRGACFEVGLSLDLDLPAPETAPEED